MRFFTRVGVIFWKTGQNFWETEQNFAETETKISETESQNAETEKYEIFPEYMWGKKSAKKPCIDSKHFDKFFFNIC